MQLRWETVGKGRIGLQQSVRLLDEAEGRVGLLFVAEGTCSCQQSVHHDESVLLIGQQRAYPFDIVTCLVVHPPTGIDGY